MKVLASAEFLFIAYVAIFIGVLLAFEGLRQLLSLDESESEVKNRRLRLMNKGATGEDVLNLLDAGPKSSARAHWSPFGSLRRMLGQAGLSVGPFTFFAISAVLGGTIFAVGSRFIGLPLAAAASVVLGLGVPLMVVSLLCSARRQKLIAQLPDALDLMARGLKVGHPLAVTVGNVASEMPDPLGSEFGMIQDQVQYGDDIVTAFRQFAERTDCEDTRYLAVAVAIQHGSGGSLARVLKVLSTVIRDRAVMRKKVMAISSEGRLSAIILTFLPLGIFLSIHVATPTFYGDVKDDPLFLPVIGAIFFLIALQGFVLNRLVSFKF